MNDRAPTGGSTRKRHALELFGGLPRHYDRVAAVLSFGQDPRWRRTMVAAVDARPGERVLDVATGRGAVLFPAAAGACERQCRRQSLARAQSVVTVFQFLVVAATPSRRSM